MRTARRDARWAARYQRSQAGIEASNFHSESVGGWVGRVVDPNGIRYQITVTPPGEPLRDDNWFYVRLVISFFVRFWTPRPANEQWVVEVRTARQRTPISTARFTAAAAATEHVRQLRVRLRAGDGLPDP